MTRADGRRRPGWLDVLSLLERTRADVAAVRADVAQLGAVLALEAARRRDDLRPLAVALADRCEPGALRSALERVAGRPAKGGD